MRSTMLLQTSRKEVLMPRTGKTMPVPVRLSEELRKALARDAERSGWSVSEQIRYELAERRGLWKVHAPYLPSPKPQSK